MPAVVVVVGSFGEEHKMNPLVRKPQFPKIAFMGKITGTGSGAAGVGVSYGM